MDMQSAKVRHIVVFEYKKEASPQQINHITEAFAQLKNKIPGIVTFESGLNHSPENHAFKSETSSKGCVYIYQMTFESLKARDDYLPHPKHQAFVTQLLAQDILNDIFVVDYSV